LPELKKEYDWLKEINSQSLQQAICHLDVAFTSFFKGKRTKQKLALLHEKVRNKRHDFLHQITKKLVVENQTQIRIELPTFVGVLTCEAAIPSG
jgi:transposase